MIAAEQLERGSLPMEIGPRYAQVTIDRCVAFHQSACNEGRRCHTERQRSNEDSKAIRESGRSTKTNHTPSQVCLVARHT